MHARNGWTSLATFVSEPIWAGLKPEVRNGTVIKAAINPYTGQPVVGDDPNAWRPLGVVRTWATMHDAVGVAVRLGEVGNVVILGADLHACRDPETGEVAPWAREVTSRLKTRTEVSPGGAGLHPLFCVSPADLPAVRELFNGQAELIFRLNGGNAAIKLYGLGAYLAVTEEIWGDTEDLRTVDPAELEWLLHDYGPMFAGQDDGAELGQVGETESQAQNTENGAEARAETIIADLKAAGAAYKDALPTLLAAEDDGATAGVAEWTRAEGMKHGERELRRIYNKAKGPKETIDVSAPYDIARMFQLSLATPLLHHRAGFFDWNGHAWPPAGPDMLRALLYEFLDGHQSFNAKAKIIPVKPNPRMVGDVLNALRSAGQLDDLIEPPVWLTNAMAYGGNVIPFDKEGPPPQELVACTNGILHLPTKRLLPHTPSFFNHNALDFAYDPKVPPPKLWLAFLDQLWPRDPQSIATLQESFGLCLTPDTRQQKLFMLIGPRRSGKGTIGRVLRVLIGPHNCVAPTLADLGIHFGLEPLIGKTVAIISDARLSARADQQEIVTQILSITGEDGKTVGRKNSSAWTGKLNVRFFIISNELPKLPDASGALAGRTVLIQLTQSFYGREDQTLTEKLLTELPGILNWAIAGWDRLKRRGYFQQPAAGAETMTELEDLASPISAFVRERLDAGSQYSADVDVVFYAWTIWCKEQNRSYPGNKQSFGRDLRTVFPKLTTTQPRTDGRQIRRSYQGIRVKPQHEPDLTRQPDPGRPAPGEGLS